MFIKIMVIFLQKKTPYKSKHRAFPFLQIFQTKILSSSDYINQKKAQWSNTNRTFQYVFHASQAIKYVIKPGQNSLSAASLIIFFDFLDTYLLKILTLIEIIHALLFIFASVWFAFIFLVKENFPRQTETITLLLFIHKHGAFSFCSHPIFSLTYPISFLRGAILYFIRCHRIFSANLIDNSVIFW